MGLLDQLFLDAYLPARDAQQASQLPSILVSGSDVVLYAQSKPEGDKVRVIPDLYHALKSIVHLPFAVYLRLRTHIDAAPLDEAVVSELQRFAERIPAARASSGFGLNSEQLARHDRILDATESFLKAVLHTQRVTGPALAAFARETGPDMTASAFEAGCAQVENLHAQVVKWRAMLTADEWSRLRIVVRGKHQARFRNAATLYFGRLLRAPSKPWAYPGESLRVVFAEFLSEKERARDVLAAVELDAAASLAFFGDEWRLSEDILSDGADACATRLLPNDVNTSSSPP